MTNTNYALTRELKNTTFEAAVSRTREALAAEGFGVLTEIDIARTFEAKLGVRRPPYLILGACNPQFAHQALSAEPGMGVLLPCNVSIFVDDDDRLWVQAVNAETLFEVVGNPSVAPLAREVGARLSRALDQVAR